VAVSSSGPGTVIVVLVLVVATTVSVSSSQSILNRLVSGIDGSDTTSPTGTGLFFLVMTQQIRGMRRYLDIVVSGSLTTQLIHDTIVGRERGGGVMCKYSIYMCIYICVFANRVFRKQRECQ
jgi:hypothetical protein